LAIKEGIDILFTPTVCMPLFCTLPQVVTIHDLIHKTWPKDMSWKNRILMSLFIDNSIRRANRVICVSESTRHDIENHIGKKKGNGYLKLVVNYQRFSLHQKKSIDQ
jgi:hypothetical protein